MIDAPIYPAAIIGLGRIGSLLDDSWADETIRDESWRLRPCTHAGQLMAHPRTRLVAGADPNPAYRDAFTRRWGVPAFADHREMLETIKPDVVSVCTRAVDRPGPTLDAIAAGARALLLEKHLAGSLHDGEMMVAAAEAAGIPAVINHTFRFDPRVRALRAAVVNGAIGAVQSIVAYPGARLVHSGTHFFDLCRFFGAGEPVAVFGRLDGDSDGDDPPGSGYVEFDSGVRLYIDGRPRAAHGYLEIHGSDGVARVGNDAHCTVELWTQPPRDKPEDAYYQPRLQAGAVPLSDRPDWETIDLGRNITNGCIDEVVACLDERRMPIASIRDGLISLEIAAAIHVSHRAGGKLLPLPLAERGLLLKAI